MARVLVTTFSHLAQEALDSFREAFVDALVAAGNEVLLMRTEDFMKSPHSSNDLKDEVDETALMARLGEAAPEAVISFNHSGLFAALVAQAEVPIGVWLVDGPAYLVDRASFAREAGRYRVFAPSRAFMAELAGGYGVAASRLSWLPFCSDFVAEEVEQTIPISFVGTFFHTIGFPRKLARHHASPATWERLRGLVESYRDDQATSFAERLTTFRLEHVLGDPFDEAGLLNTLSLNRRLHVLEAVCDLGLRIYGNARWLEALPFSADLVFAFQREGVHRRAELQALYNRSRLALSVSHAQARGGVPWRVFDIMATNAVLVTDHQPDLAELFPGLGLPSFDSPAEAREACVRLLGDEGLRRETSAAARASVDAGHRFRHRLARMGEELGVSLLPGGRGSLLRLDPRAFTRPGAPAAPSPDQGTRWPFKILFSETTRFSGSRSTRKWCRVGAGGRLDVRVRLDAAPAFLRLDPGEAFSVHLDPVLTVRCLDGEGGGASSATAVVDLGAPVSCSQVRVEAGPRGRRLTCGGDPQFVFRNPFPGRDVEVRFQSTVEAVL